MVWAAARCFPRLQAPTPASNRQETNHSENLISLSRLLFAGSFQNLACFDDIGAGLTLPKEFFGQCRGSSVTLSLLGNCVLSHKLTSLAQKSSETGSPETSIGTKSDDFNSDFFVRLPDAFFLFILGNGKNTRSVLVKFQGNSHVSSRFVAFLTKMFDRPHAGAFHAKTQCLFCLLKHVVPSIACKVMS